MSDIQKEAIQSIKNGDNLFLTGSGGTGKTYISKLITDENTIVTSPTGVAALNAGGITCHRAFSLPTGLVTKGDNNKISSNMRKLFGEDSPIKRILIDELPMLRVDFFDLIDQKLKKIRNSDEPFGGLQIVGVGDFFQLEPIVSYNEYKLFYERYESPYCFSSNLWDFKTIELDKVYRQEDERQVKILNSIRRGDKYSKIAIQRINEECSTYENTQDTLHLCAYKRDAEEINNYWYNQLKTKEKTYNCRITGKDNWKDSPVPHQVKLKEGSKVLIKANSQCGSYVNGSRGTVYRLNSDTVDVELLNGKVVRVYMNGWSKHEYTSSGGSVNKNISSSFVQIPIVLAYGMTIHSVQGLTLDKATIHTGKGMFGNGQLYVGLSRIKDIRNMSFVNPIEFSDLKVSSEVKRFYKNVT